MNYNLIKPGLSGNVSNQNYGYEKKNVYENKR